MIGALIDANLLTRSSSSPIIAIVRAAITGQFRKLVALETINEVRAKIGTKPYLAARISVDDLETLLRTLQEIGDIHPPLTATISAVSRDSKDDDLLAHAVAAGADVLVSGDADLLTLGSYGGVEILSPSAFAARLGIARFPVRRSGAGAGDASLPT